MDKNSSLAMAYDYGTGGLIYQWMCVVVEAPEQAWWPTQITSSQPIFCWKYIIILTYTNFVFSM